jgi:hypothetical protein
MFIDCGQIYRSPQVLHAQMLSVTISYPLCNLIVLPTISRIPAVAPTAAYVYWVCYNASSDRGIAAAHMPLKKWALAYITIIPTPEGHLNSVPRLYRYPRWALSHSFGKQLPNLYECWLPLHPMPYTWWTLANSNRIVCIWWEVG